jgi:hypothetical protein
VTCTGLFVEHFQEYNLIWNGERGRVFFYQHELPNEPGTQSAWTAATRCPILYWFMKCGQAECTVTIETIPSLDSKFVKQVGVSLNRVYTRNFSGPGRILSVNNGVGDEVNSSCKGPNYFTLPEEDKCINCSAKQWRE